MMDSRLSALLLSACAPSDTRAPCVTVAREALATWRPYYWSFEVWHDTVGKGIVERVNAECEARTMGLPWRWG